MLNGYIKIAPMLAVALTASLLVSVADASSRKKDSGRKTYRWVDDQGVVHYGDSVPAEYSKIQRDILNDQAVMVDSLDREKTDEELAEDARLADIAAAEEKALRDAELRDRVLLSTYLSVMEIEDLRDRRLELLSAQIRVTEIYLGNLRDRLGKLQDEAQSFSPYNPEPSAPPIDEKLALELSDTMESIMLYEQTLANSKTEQLDLMTKFDSDIKRFRELKVENRD